MERCSCDEALVLRDALDRIAALCGCPNWTHAVHITRAVYTVVGERDLLRADLQRREQRRRRSARALGAMTLADILVWSAPELAYIDNLRALLSALESHERLAAEHWARATIAAGGNLDRIPTTPPTIRSLYQRLAERNQEDEPCSQG